MNKYINTIVNAIQAKTGNTDSKFFNPVAAYYLAKIASNMRCSVVSPDKGSIPCNVYACCLAGSGYGKGQSINFIEDELIYKFKERFINKTLPDVTEAYTKYLVQHYADSFNLNPEDIQTKIESAVKSGGLIPFSFDNATAPAVKQLRNALLCRGIGALSSEQDEIGSNLTANTELLNIFLELYDLGKVKPKLIKNTSDSKREFEPEGRVPANLLMFGTPSKLFDGGNTEAAFDSLLLTGYARRCIFGYGTTNKSDDYFNMPIEQLYDSRTHSISDLNLGDLANYFESLSDISYYNAKVTLSREVDIALLDYQRKCEHKARDYKEHEQLTRIELEHRYFKALKLAGIFCFIDKRTEVTLQDLEEAIELVEESADSYIKFIKRDKDYVRLAKFIDASDEPVTSADIQDTLPWFKGSRAKEAMLNAKAWGYKNSCVIHTKITDGIEFYSTLKLTPANPEILKVSVSQDKASNFIPIELDYTKFKNMLTTQDTQFYWCNHTFMNNYRNKENVNPFFNNIVLDIDGTYKLEDFKQVFKDYQYILHTTKSHTPEENCYRVIIPIKYELEMSRETYKKFMRNVLNWIPFPVDERVCYPEQMWAAVTADLKPEFYINTGNVLDPTPFIPATLRNDEFKASRAKVKSLDKLQLWVLEHANEGDRNNTLFRYAMMLRDDGKDFKEVLKAVLAINRLLDDPLDEQEIENTIEVSLRKEYE